MFLPPRPALVCLQTDDRTSYRSWMDSHQIDDAEQPHPDDVERVPEQSEAEQAPLHSGSQTLECDLSHHNAQPDHPRGDVQPMTADQGKERGQERTSLRGGADGDHAGEL